MIHAVDPVRWCVNVQGVIPDPWQEEFLTSESRRHILNCCRQSGKSTCVGWRTAHRLKYRPGYFLVATAPSERQVLELFSRIRESLDRAGEFEEKPVKDNMHEVVLANGSRCICLPSNPDTIRGFAKANELLFEEAAMIQDEVFTAVEPMIMRSRGGITLLSTPKGQRGHFYNMWTSGDGWKRSSVNVHAMLERGHFDRADVEQFRREHGEWMYRQEYECEFLSTADAVFSADLIASAIGQDVEAWAW